MQCPIGKESQETPQQTMPLVCKNTFKQIVEVFFQCFYKALEQHWSHLCGCNFANLEFVFAHWVN